MNFHRKTIIIFTIVLVLILATVFYSLSSQEKPVDYSMDVKPILNKKCISCHGGVKKQSGFSLLFEDEALAPAKSGKRAIVPGHPEESEMIIRLNSDDPEVRMPYKHQKLSKEEIDILTRWVKQGAKWGDHWAYLPVKDTAVPDVDDPWIKNDIDRFIYNKFEEQDLSPSVKADKATMLRRISLDLIGMPPSEKITANFMNSKDLDRSYEILVDSLLASPKFGEKWASMWLDVARYADTKGYEADHNRDIWKYRDWVIKAFNQDKPYNQFITEQIAGDLLPDPTDEQFIATAFHRNTISNDEGGTDNEEFRVVSVLDRVNTTWEGIMSTTFACVQCHSHPYDPFKHEDYFKFMAYFNNTRDEDVIDDYPKLRSFEGGYEVKLKELEGWLKNVSPAREKQIIFFLKTGQTAIYSTTADQLKNAAVTNKNGDLVLRNNGEARLASVDLEKCDQLIFKYRTESLGAYMEMHVDKVDGPLVSRWKLEPTGKKEKIMSVDFQMQKGIKDIYFTFKNAGAILSKANKNTASFDWFHFTRQFPGKGLPGYEGSKKLYWELLTANVPSTPIMVENPTSMWRKSFVFERGAWTSHGAEVEPGVPKSLSYAMPKNAPKNRIGLAMWLTDKQNPLVSRTIVNRLWEQVFGTGIVETLEDMGTQGMPPTHRELLDHLSYRFMNDYGWSIKKLLKEMVMSAAYRQDSKLSEEGSDKDPYNRYYARGPRFRLSAEQIRDQALAISGVYNPKMFGPGVMPWQPEGIWSSPYSNEKWKNSKGSNAYRRAVYTYWKRTAPYPSSITFDGVQRLLCSARRIRTNTPLQVLVTLNDSVFVDLSRRFASRMQKEAGNNAVNQIKKGYELMMFKPISPSKLNVLSGLYNDALTEYRSKPDQAALITGKEKVVRPEDAALVVVSNAMLNLDEFITKN